ncbi:MAG: serine/threonine-protein kinase [Acidobacteriota bacterium]
MSASDIAPDEPTSEQATDPAALRPGVVVAERYRVLRCLGSGSMGEVYSARDLGLRGFAALKVSRGEASWRLAQEVRAARRVSHPNVCRVHEIGSFHGRVFLSMELIEGETLEAVLRRTLGDLGADERLRIAHDLCAGLEAIHAAGVLHRDLKPSNVMLDALGRAIISDFGIALVDGVAVDRASGTPAYRAPELTHGGEPSVHSDLYALGLVVYELYVGSTGSQQPAAGAADPAGTPGGTACPAGAEAPGLPFPSGRKIPPEVREAIVRCTDPVADARPASAREVAALLPPRPKLRSDLDDEWIAPPQTLLVTPRQEPQPVIARWLLLASLVLLWIIASFDAAGPWVRGLTAAQSRTVLAVRAGDLLTAAGTNSSPQRTGFTSLPDTLPASRRPEQRRPEQRRPERRSVSATDSVTSTNPVVFWAATGTPHTDGEPSSSPFHAAPAASGLSVGEAVVWLTLDGTLLRFAARPERSEGTHPPTDWRPFFAAAGHDPETARAIEPTAAPPVFADRVDAWTVPGSGALPPAVEGASLDSRPVWFDRVVSSATPVATDLSSETVAGGAPWSRAQPWLFGLWFVVGALGAAVLAHHSMKRHAADLGAGFRLAVVVFSARLLVFFIGSDRLIGPGALTRFEAHLASALLAAALVWIIYVALEPLARRFLPRQTASWVRVVYGRWRDPLVGRDLLLGVVVGLAASLGARLYGALAGPSLRPLGDPDAFASLSWVLGHSAVELQLEALRGLREAVAMLLYASVHATLLAFFGALGVVCLRAVSPHPAVSRTAALILLVALLAPSVGHPALALGAAVLASALWLVTLVRYGFLAALTATIVAWLLASHPLTLDLDVWFVQGSAASLAAVAAVAGFGFIAALGQERAVPSLNRLQEEDVADLH